MVGPSSVPAEEYLPQCGTEGAFGQAFGASFTGKYKPEGGLVTLPDAAWGGSDLVWISLDGSCESSAFLLVRDADAAPGAVRVETLEPTP
jgi:hypothetical protein